MFSLCFWCILPLFSNFALCLVLLVALICCPSLSGATEPILRDEDTPWWPRRSKEAKRGMKNPSFKQERCGSKEEVRRGLRDGLSNAWRDPLQVVQARGVFAENLERSLHPLERPAPICLMLEDLPRLWSGRSPPSERPAPRLERPTLLWSDRSRRALLHPTLDESGCSLIWSDPLQSLRRIIFEVWVFFIPL